jgi:hypothetical protein
LIQPIRVASAIVLGCYTALGAFTIGMFYAPAAICAALGAAARR